MAKKQSLNGERGRWSAKAKREAVLRLLRGEAIDALSRELKVTAAKLSEWREAFLAEAIRYTFTLWPALTRYRDDRRIEIDNNAAERAARCYSLIGTAKLNGLDPEALVRRDGVTLTELLDRLDAALAKAFATDDYTDEING